MVVSMENENFRQRKSSDDRRDSGIDPQTFAESLTPQLCSPLEKQSNSDILNLSQSSYLSDSSLEAEKVDSIPSVKEMVRQREMMALKPNTPMSQILPVKASSRVETPEVKVKLIVQQFESCLQDDGKFVASNAHTLPKSEDKKTRSCSRLPSFLKHSLSYMNDSNTYHSDSCPSLMNSLANSVTAPSDSDYPYSVSRKQMLETRRCENLIRTNNCQASKRNSLSPSSTCLSVDSDSLNKTPEKNNPEKHSKNLKDLTQHENLSPCRVNSKLSSETLSMENSCLDSLDGDNSQNGIFQIEVSEDSKSNLKVRTCRDSGSNFSEHANNTWSIPKNKESKLDDHNTSHGTSLYKLVKSLREIDIPTKMRSTTSSDFPRNLNSPGSQASSSPMKTRPSLDSLSSVCQHQYPTVTEETVSTKWILDKLRLSCPDLDIYYDPNEICSAAKLEEIFEDLKNLFSAKKDSDKNMISLFRENRSAMRLIRKQAKDLEERYNFLQWKSVYTNRRVTELTSRHQEAMELEDILNVRLANIQDELPDGVWLPPTRSLAGMLEAVLEGESLLLAKKYKKVISNLQQRLKYNRAKETDNETQLETNISFLQSHSLDHMSDDLLKGKELVLLKEEISTLYTEMKKLTSERNHLIMANKTLHNELQQSHNKISHFEQDICSHICQHKKLKPQNFRDCNNPRHFLDIQELRTRLQEQSQRIEQQNKIVDLLGALINATREVLHQQEHETQSIPGVCKLLKMIEGEINPSSVVLEASATSPWF